MFIHASTRVRCCAQHPILGGGGAALVPRIRPQRLPPRSQHLRSEAWSLLCILKLSHCANAGKELHHICNIVHLLSCKPLNTRQSKQGEFRIYVLEKLLLYCSCGSFVMQILQIVVLENYFRLLSLIMFWIFFCKLFVVDRLLQTLKVVVLLDLSIVVLDNFLQIIVLDHFSLQILHIVALDNLQLLQIRVPKNFLKPSFQTGDKGQGGGILTWDCLGIYLKLTQKDSVRVELFRF